MILYIISILKENTLWHKTLPIGCRQNIKDLGRIKRTNNTLGSGLAVESAMPYARNLCSTRLSKLQSCALLCLGIPPLLLLACIIWVYTCNNTLKYISTHSSVIYILVLRTIYITIYIEREREEELSLWINQASVPCMGFYAHTIWSEFASCGLRQWHDWWRAHPGLNSWEHGY